jgi:hypothetical protein
LLVVEIEHERAVEVNDRRILRARGEFEFAATIFAGDLTFAVDQDRQHSVALIRIAAQSLVTGSLVLPDVADLEDVAAIDLSPNLRGLAIGRREHVHDIAVAHEPDRGLGIGTKRQQAVFRGRCGVLWLVGESAVDFRKIGGTRIGETHGDEQGRGQEAG